MTTHKTLKRRVRARMDKTGERYTAARRNVTAAADAPSPAATATSPASAPPPVSDEAVRKATGRGWDEWLAILDGAGAAGWKHPDIARWVAARFTAQSPAKSQVALQQDPLPDASAVEDLRAFWRPRLADLKKRLEGGSPSA